MSQPILDTILKKLLKNRQDPPGTSAGLTIEEVNWLCSNVVEIFKEQPVLLELQTPITICGDIHGQYHDLHRVFDKCKYPPFTNYIFLGDYVDRGIQSIETVCLLFAFKIKYPENFFMLRGNHECDYINTQFGFRDECITRYNEGIWQTFNDVFNYLPIAAIIEEKIFCVHGGISPTILSLDEIRDIQRPYVVPDEGIICDLLWSDPDPEVDQWDDNDRGVSYVFGAAPLKRFLKRFGFDLVVRAHQAIMGGYDFPFPEEQGIVTLFTAPNYCYQYGNKAATMTVNQNLYCSFVVLRPIKWEDQYQIEQRPGTPPRGVSCVNTPTDFQILDDDFDV